MRTLYIDSNFHLHVNNSSGMTAVETDKFDGFCDELVECHKYIPPHDGHALFVQPWKDTASAEQAQLCFEYEKIISEYEAALSDIEQALGV